MGEVGLEEAKPQITAADTERGIRDLMGLLSLSALWLGKDGLTVLEQVLEAVERIVSIQFAFAEASLLPGEPLTTRVRVGGNALNAAEIGLWKDFPHQWSRNARQATSVATLAGTPIGELKVVRMQLGVSVFDGGVWFGSTDAAFPTTTQLAIFRAAASLAATAIQAARIQFERDQSHNAKDEFLAMLGHELRNPLAPIRTGASVLLQDGISAIQIKKTATIIQRQVGHMTGLVDSLLDVSRISTGAVILAEEVVDMKSAFNDALEQISPFFAAKGHYLSVKVCDENVQVFGDRNRLVQVLSNLFSNASKYTQSGGSISLCLEVFEKDVVITVQDNGIGIEPAMMMKMFQLFSQAKRSADRFEGGLGLGLALAKKLVDLHKGHITGHSEGLGKGATFEVRLSRLVCLANEPHLPTCAVSAKEARPLKILVVDDNSDAAELLGEMLQMFGHSVFVENHPIVALERATDIQADVYLLDIGLPEIDGYELARRLRANSALSKLTLVALTGYGQAEDVEKAYAAGFNFHCVKPVDMNNLNSILAEVGRQRNQPTL